MPLATLAPTITSTGISAPSYSAILTSLQQTFQGIYGSDVYLAPDSQDGQFLAIVAKAISDSNQAMIATFQAFSPSYAQGTNLSALVRINGLTRQTASNSTAVGNVVGTAGTLILNGVVQDANRNLWNLPASVTIPNSGTIAVTVTAQQPGNLVALSGTINVVYTPTYGWVSFTSTTDAVPGAPLETDAALRLRQAISVSLPALTPLAAIEANILAVPAVVRAFVYENPTGTTDSNGIPEHSISAVVQGGDLIKIATAIEATKSPGTGTYGSTSEIITDPAGVPITINFYVLALTQIYVAVTIKALPGYVSTTGALVQQTIQTFINALAIGGTVYYSWVQATAGLIGNPLQTTFKLVSLAIGTTPSPVGTSDLTIAFNAAANVSALTNIGLTVT